MRARASVIGASMLTLLLAAPARAGSFDESGQYHSAPAALAFESFETSPKIHCENNCSYETIDADAELALSGKRYLRVSAQQDVFEADLTLPPVNQSLRFSAWVRHARVFARMNFEYSDPTRGIESAWMFPSGRVTSDGWVELVSNPVSVTGRDLTRAFFRLEGTNVDLDAVEVWQDGEYDSGGACAGAFDPICGPEAVCIAERCRQGARFVPPLPAPAERQKVAKYLSSRVSHFYGGRFSRLSYMPTALATMSEMLDAKTAWQYWGAFARGVRLLHDWHTLVSTALSGQGSPRQLGVCFIEGVADRSQSVWPSQAGRSDILVSHVGPDGTLGLGPGDRLVAVDGQHPIDFARSLVGVNWGYHIATDPDVDADLVEALRDLIPRFAKTFSVVRCDPQTLECSQVVETIPITDIGTGIQPPACDNRPLYHLANPPDPNILTYHYVPFFPWRDLVLDSQPGEQIFGMTFDNLYGTAQGLTPYFHDSNQFFKDNARGVILDHRAGNGGTVDAPEAITELVRTSEGLSVGPGFAAFADDDGPATLAEGAAIVQKLVSSGASVYAVGSSSPDLAIPVALIIHRDGSASDWLPHGMKGAPNVKVFGPHQTNGAFSSFYQFSYWSRLDFQLASGDTLLLDGTPLIGHGIHPDIVVEHSQTTLLSGVDAPYEAALAWVRGNLKP